MISTFIKMVKVTKDKERLRSCHELEDATKINEEYWIRTGKKTGGEGMVKIKQGCSLANCRVPVLISWF